VFNVRVYLQHTARVNLAGKLLQCNMPSIVILFVCIYLCFDC